MICFTSKSSTFSLLTCTVFMSFAITVSLSTLEPNLCDEKRTTQCDEYAVCCELGNEQYGCCPFTGGTCCPGHASCCPPGFSCTSTGTCKRMRTDVGSIPLMCLLSTLTSSVLGYLPNEDLTNAIIPGGGYPPTDTIIPSEGEEDSSPDEESDGDGTDIYRKKVSTFRRRNINAPFGGRVPFSRMAYKAGYGSNRIGFSRTSGGTPSLGSYYGERNPYGTVTLGGSGGSFPSPHVPEEYNMRPSAPYSGLIGGSRASGYYGSTVGMRRGGVTPMSSRKPKLPTTDYPPDYASNDLMNSFNGNSQPAIPSLRELATYASRYGPAYLRERFGAHESQMERMPYGGPQVPPRGGGIPIDFNMNIASNHWNHGMKGVGAPIGIMSRDVDSYQHDDTVTKANNKKSGRSTTTTTTDSSVASSSTTRPKKARKPVKKTSTTSTTTAKPEKKPKRAT